MANTPLGKTDYYDASHLRCEDFKYLRNNPQSKSIVFAVYCAGVAVESMLRAYILKIASEFNITSNIDTKHDLKRLYQKSQMSIYLDEIEKETVSSAIIKISEYWDNTLRYSSEKRIKRLIGHELARSKNKHKNFNKYLNIYYSDFFEACELIIKIGAEKWN